VGNFAVRLGHGAGWDASRPIRKQNGWDEHAAFMEGLADDGFILLGGPLGNDHVLHVIAAGSEQEIRDRLGEDPWEPMGLLRNVSIEPWHVLLGKAILEDLQARRTPS